MPRENMDMRDEEGEPTRLCDVVNPGNFSQDLSFLVLYPSNTAEPIQLSKLPQ